MAEPSSFPPSDPRVQYKTPVNFNARVALHRRFSVQRSGGGIFRWMFDQMSLPADARVVELGSGTALFWRANADRIPRGWRITLSDCSAGMLDDVRSAVASIAHPFSFMQIDAQSLPFDDRSFDAVVANHMLYHVPDIPLALGEIRRILKPGQRCYAATMGLDNMREFNEMVQRFVGFPTDGAARRFGLETGFEHMRKVFAQVEVRKFEDALNVTEAQPLVDYVSSMNRGKEATEAGKQALKDFAEAEIRARGGIYMKKVTGILIATA